MQFFEYNATMESALWCDRNECTEKKSELFNRTVDFNGEAGDKTFTFISDVSNKNITVGIITTEEIDCEKAVGKFLSRMEISAAPGKIAEITFERIRMLLSRADRMSFIYDDCEVLEKFRIGIISTPLRNSVDFAENTVAPCKKEDIYSSACELTTADGLISELDRIYSGGAEAIVKGHPVHYFIETDDTDIRRETHRTLLRALYDRRRIRNQKYCFADVYANTRINCDFYNALYNMNKGGCVIIRFTPSDDDEGGYASSSRENIEYICNIMKKYRNSVLTVFCLPRECTRVKEIFYEYLHNTSFVEIREDPIYGDRARYFLNSFAEKHGVEADELLFSKFDAEKGYLFSELSDMFDEWYDGHLKTSVFPQYDAITSVSKAVKESKPKGSAYDELMGMIGLDEAKKVIKRALDFNKAQKLFAARGMRNERGSMHMVFTGNPGTAKTSVARLFAQIMKENGLLSKGTFVEVGRGDLVGKYVGWTAKIVQSKFAEAKGGVLFIDEAYSLVDDSNSYGDEAINTIVQEMENRRDDVIVIFAGYPDKMEEFLRTNPGLRSRIAFHVPFEDYNADELLQIAELFAKKKGFRFTDGARDKMHTVFENAQNESDFGNGRYVRNIVEKAKMCQSSRLVAMDLDSVTEMDLSTIRAEDIEIPFAYKKKPIAHIGFAG